ncbi:hypothetical protein BX616_002078 [Lobosporangium transversale]|uniref:F-box domain-containing protein n=1 Tax=Lobosporangium transversale TaxID=64571 RepID=A0A1Y2GGN3_9FUNG|nr:hypothetical protein BCR41DRAFT_357745 [Lobosporangium transversale]KAF9901973.1 hypothetical protein BX616_002078 [Lobosporangium transversale]ORZ10313.1 hypothetical protein BCR41DRAFT_357745 [Lobosporangium transversale]|eukprot:XP_021879220.1 hypothetical protein BCR41DRAFT_357745 [Lobosporangium transversale]
MQQHPLDLPEVIQNLGQFLQHEDLLSCLRVSKTFHSVLIKYLWEAIDAWDHDRKRSTYPRGKTLQNHKKYIKRLVFIGNPPREYMSLQGCSVLHTISATLPEKCTSSLLTKFSRLIKAHSSTMRHVEFWIEDSLHISISGPEPWKTLLECPRISSLSIGCMKFRNDEVDLLFQVCTKLQKLNLDYGCISELPEYVQDESSNFVLPHLRSLTLCNRYNRHGDERPFSGVMLHLWGIFVRKCPSLEKLDCLHPKHGKILKVALLQNPWIFPHLRDLTLNDSVSDEELAAILRQMAQVRNFKVPSSYFGPLALHELLADRGRQLDVHENRDRITRTDRLCDTIEELQAASGWDKTDGVAQAILSNCPRLRVLAAAKITVTEIVQGPKWVCSRIEKLCLYFQMDLDPESEEGTEKQRMVFGQLGKLTELQYLDLTHYCRMPTLDLRLGAGLNGLANLKRLTTVRSTSDDYQAMGPEEAKWIVENWPKFFYLDVATNKDPDIAGSISRIFRPHNIFCMQWKSLVPTV